MSTVPKTRLEHDLLGDIAFPAAAYYGVQTARALDNFHISGVRAPPVSRPHQGVRHGQARGGAGELRLRAVLEGNPEGIEGACAELIDGKLHDEFRLDVFQGGAGTSTNMNANEVIAEPGPGVDGAREGRLRALRPPRPRQLLRSPPTTPTRPPSTSAWHWATSVRRGDEGARSTPSATKGEGVLPDPEDGPDAAPGRRPDDPRPGVQRLRRDAARRGRRPRARSRTSSARSNMGATAIGTGLNAPAGYAEKCTKHLAKVPAWIPDPPRSRT